MPGGMTPAASAIMARLVERALAAGFSLDRRRVVYLLHFDRPFGHAQHYLGITNRRLGARLLEHVAGHPNGPKLAAAVVTAGIGVQVVRLWRGGYGLETRLKRRKKNTRLCPICDGRPVRPRARPEGAAPPHGGMERPTDEARLTTGAPSTTERR
jgi:hypothetical protein